VNRVSTLLTIVIFGALGPGIGVLFAMVLFLQLDWSVVPVAYVLCWVPAALAGLAWGELARYLWARHLLNWATRAASGALIGAIASVLWVRVLTARTPVPLLYATCGAVAGLTLAIIFPLEPWLLTPPSNYRSRVP